MEFPSENPIGASDFGTGNISFWADINQALSLNTPAEISDDLEVPQINVTAAMRAEARLGKTADLLLPFAVETVDGSDFFTLKDPGDPTQ